MFRAGRLFSDFLAVTPPASPMSRPRFGVGVSRQAAASYGSLTWLSECLGTDRLFRHVSEAFESHPTTPPHLTFSCLVSYFI